MFEFKGKVAIVTGAASGMGLAAARAYAKGGAAVGLVDINDASEYVKEIESAGGKAIAIQCDVSDENSAKEAVKKVVDTFGRLDVAFNNAGIQNDAKDIVEVSGEEFDKTVAINLKGIWNFMKYELEQMGKQGSGSVVNNSSLGGLVGVAGRGAYHAAKHGVLGLTKSSALEYAERGIRINAICPGIIETPMVTAMLEREPDAMNYLIEDVPAKRLGEAEEIADVVMWLSSNYSSYVTGQAIPVDGGYTSK
ncbi:SDR family oxidoreductase [Fulvivirga maritima]|uniref:SDR family NAD(P)-dependent oxidoreductase n=1 Tax=Fulvivirga maritima TaxID=2904247 RepID=UPI001F23E938|nr:SDR family NAD(P)-dependent oxidoreductase [Fulvivirga maritima]UII25737.1 SDR family oxidoreductase [Fulvivirga maritima]